MAGGIWEEFDTALHRVAVDLYDLTEDWGLAYRSAWETIFSGLIDGTIYARTKASGFVFGSRCKTHSLMEGNVIPAGFWFAFRDAEQEQPSLVTLIDLEDSWAERRPPNGFGFRLNRFDQPPVMGAAEAVEIRFTRGKLVKREGKQRGRRRGNQYPSDRQYYLKAQKMMKDEGISAHQAAQRVAPAMEGAGTLESKIDRMRKYLTGANKPPT